MFTTNNIYNSSQHKIANSDVQDGLTGWTFRYLLSTDSKRIETSY